MKKAFLSINADLINNPKYKDLSNDALMMFALYEQRQQVSIFHASQGDNRFVDKEGAFVFFSNEDMANILRISLRKVTSLRKSLVQHGLISVKRSGLTTFKIYVNEPEETPEGVSLAMAWSNFSFEEKPATRLANIADSDTQILPVNQSQTNQSKLNISRETSVSPSTEEVVQPKTVTDFSTSSLDLEKQSLESLYDRMNTILPKNVIGRINVLAQGKYEEAKELFDTIFKAKSQVSNRLLSCPTWLYDDGAVEATRFEHNDFLTRGLESALLQVTEIIYKGSNNIKNKSNFIYVYLRNFMASAVKAYITGKYELKIDDEIELNMLMNFVNERKLA